MSRFLFVSDNVKRYSDDGKKALKHCVEIQWESGTGVYGGVGFGEGSSYVRYTSFGSGIGRDGVTFSKAEDVSSIQMNDKRRILVCLDSTISPHLITVIKGDIKRKGEFIFNNQIDKLHLLTYSYNSSNSDNLYIYLHKSQFSNAVPEGYKGWADNEMHTCLKTSQISFRMLYITFLLN